MLVVQWHVSYLLEQHSIFSLFVTSACVVWANTNSCTKIHDGKKNNNWRRRRRSKCTTTRNHENMNMLRHFELTHKLMHTNMTFSRALQMYTETFYVSNAHTHNGAKHNSTQWIKSLAHKHKHTLWDIKTRAKRMRAIFSRWLFPVIYTSIMDVEQHFCRIPLLFWFRFFLFFLSSYAYVCFCALSATIHLILQLNLVSGWMYFMWISLYLNSYKNPLSDIWLFKINWKWWCDISKHVVYQTVSKWQR